MKIFIELKPVWYVLTNMYPKLSLLKSQFVINFIHAIANIAG